MPSPYVVSGGGTVAGSPLVKPCTCRPCTLSGTRPYAQTLTLSWFSAAW